MLTITERLLEGAEHESLPDDMRRDIRLVARAHPSLVALLERVELVNRGVAESTELIGLAKQARFDLNT